MYTISESFEYSIQKYSVYSYNNNHVTIKYDKINIIPL